MTSSGYPSPLASPRRGGGSKETGATSEHETSRAAQDLVLHAALQLDTPSVARSEQASAALSTVKPPSSRVPSDEQQHHQQQRQHPELKKGARQPSSATGASQSYSDNTAGDAHAEEDAEVARYFNNSLQRAKAEGIDLFASAPTPSFRSVTPLLQHPHGRATGMVQPQVDAARLNDCLTKDYFERKSWSRSTVASPNLWIKASAWEIPPGALKPNIDRRSLETMAHHRRVYVMEDQLAKRALPAKLRSPDSLHLDDAFGSSRPQSKSGHRHQNYSRPVSQASVRSGNRRR